MFLIWDVDVPYHTCLCTTHDSHRFFKKTNKTILPTNVHENFPSIKSVKKKNKMFLTTAIGLSVALGCFV